MNKIILLLMILLTCNKCFAEILQDEIVKELGNNNTEISIHTDYNYESVEKIPIKLKIVNPIKSEKEVYEGQILEFKNTKDVIFNDKNILKKDQIVYAKVQVIITPGMNGIPGSIILNNFNAKGLDSDKFTGSYEIFGQDRSLIVFPLKWALTILPPTGSLTNFIMGGHAKIKKNKIITICYYPEWI